MLAYWMLYCASVGVLLSAGALALERGLRSLSQPTRWVWVGAMALTLALPAAARFVPAARPAPASAPAASTTAPAALPREGKVEVRQPAPVRLDLGRWDPALRLAWGAASAAVLLGLAAMAGVLAFRRRGWSTAEVDGVPVLVSPDVGPAVIGLFRSRIVLPAWTLAADEEARRLVLEHEREHVRAGDPRLLAAAFLFAALTPWSPAAWWQLRRLRLALEVDCDARVLRRRADVRAYGAVLLEVGRRASRTRLAVAAFAEPVSFLERRIRIMTAPRVRRPLLRAAAFGAVAATLVAIACETPGPTQPAPAGSRRLYAAADAGEPGIPRAKIDVGEMVARYFPEVARDGLPVGESLYFTLSAEGEVVGHARRPLPRPSAYATAPDGRRLMAVSPRDELAALNQEWPTVRSVDYMAQPAGAVAPTPVKVVWVQLKAPGENPGTLRTSSISPGADVSETLRMLDAQAAANAAAMVATMREPSGGTADQAQLQAAVNRVFASGMPGAGLRGAIDIHYTVGADGRAHDVEVRSDTPGLVRAGHSIMESLTFPTSAAGKHARLTLSTGADLVPTRRP